MAITNVSKYGIVVIKDKKDDLIKQLHKFGDVEIIKPEKDNDKDASTLDIHERLKNINDALSLLGEYSEKKSLKQMFEAKEEYTVESLFQKTSELKEEIISKINQCKENLKNINSEIQTCESEIEKYSQWIFVDIPFNSKKSLKLTSLYFLSGKEENFNALKNTLENEHTSFELKKHCEKNTLRGVLFYIKKDKETVFNAISDAGCSIEEFDLSVSCPEYLRQMQSKIDELNVESESIKKKIKKYTVHEEDIKLQQDALEITIDEIEAESKFLYTKYSAYVKVWVPDNKIDKLKEFLNKKFIEIEIMQLALDEGEKAPVVLNGNSFTAPFQSITTMYGTPERREFDPTPVFAPFFVLFFGMCLSDAGYGIVVLLFSLMGLSIKSLDKDIKKGFMLMVYCGISTIVMGALFGSWFGLPLEQMNNGFSKMLLSMKWIDPNRDALLLMGISLLLGSIQIIWSMLLSAYKELKNGSVVGMLEKVLWSVYLAIFFPCVVKYAGYIEGHSWLYKTYGYLALTMIVFYILTSRVHILLRPVQSILKLYDTVGYFGDVLSYSRLMALGLATGGVALAVNMIADLAYNMIPVVGIVAKIAILIAGHLFNIVMNVLGSFIHSMRLQFVEFFQKFFEGGGVIFKPFRFKTRHIRLLKD